MSKDTNWMKELMAESRLPSDDFTWTDGSNYGMDGFHFDQTMGEGVKNQPPLPGATPGKSRESTVRGMPDLPEEFISSPNLEDVSFVDKDPLCIVEDGLDLSSMLADSEIPITAAQAKAASLADLSWLDPTQAQDPSRLPAELKGEVVPSGAIKELENAWGVDQRTNGLTRVNLNDREVAQYNQSIKSPPPALPGVRAASELQFKNAILNASRMSHFGYPLKRIAQHLVDTLGQDSRLPKALQHIASEHGLVGTVFIRAASFPGLKNGKWVKELKKQARTARYVLTSNQTEAQKLGMLQVAEIPWKKALAHYAPMLKADGYRFATSGSAKKILQDALLKGTIPNKTSSSYLPIDKRPASFVSTKEALKSLATSEAPKVEALETIELRGIKAKRAALSVELHHWAASQFISREQAERLATSKAPLANIRQAALLLATKHKTQDYKGIGEGTNTRRASEIIPLNNKEASLEAAQKKKVAIYLAKTVNSGLLTKEEAKRILALDISANALIRTAAMAVQMASSSRQIDFKTVESKIYEGTPMKAAAQRISEAPEASPELKTIIAAAETSGIKAPEFHKLMKWARQHMSEGFIGKDLTQLFMARWAPDMLKAASTLIRDLRAKHEGLSGSVYVDVEAYAHGGVKGCEEGALRHRANQIKSVLAMPKCGGCVHAREGACSLYKKPLIKAASEIVADLKDFQKKALHMANAPDAEVTAALFSTSEFNLQSSMEEEFSLDSSLTPESLGEILFGSGVILEDN